MLKKTLRNLILGIKIEVLDLSSQILEEMLGDSEPYIQEYLYEPNGKNNFCPTGAGDVIFLL